MEYIRKFIIHLLGGFTLEENLENEKKSAEMSIYIMLGRLKLFAEGKDDRGELYHRICSELKKLI